MLERGRSISPSLPPFSATLPHLSRSSFFFFFVPFSPPPLPPSVHSFLVFSFIPLDTWYIRVYVPSPSSFLSLPTLASSHSFVQRPFHTLSLTFSTTPLRSSHLPILFTHFRIPTPAAVSRDFECIGLDTPPPFHTNFSPRFSSLLSKFTTGNLDKDFFPSSRTIESKENYFIRGENREGNNNSRKMPKRRAKEEIINREIFFDDVSVEK